MAENPTTSGSRVVFPITLNRDVRKIKQTLYDPENGLVADVKHLRRRTESLYWVAFGTFVTVLAGVASLVMKAFGA